MSTPQISKRLPNDEPFELLELLGFGGFAQTFKARVIDPQIRDNFGEEIIALKIPLADRLSSVYRDIELNILLHLRLKDLEAINLVRYLGFDLFQNKVVLAFEYITGGSLRERIGKIGHQQALGVDEALRITEGILNGLVAIHREHIFHRDIKPENILLQDDVAKIADLGIARMVDSNTFASTVAGSIPYMSPEVLSSNKATFTADIWSLGVTMYEMVTGQLPFGNADAPIAEQADLIRNLRQTPACEVGVDIPVTASDFIERALLKNPNDRFANATEMLEALQDLISTQDDTFETEINAIRELISQWGDTSEIENRLCELVEKHDRNERAFQHLGEFYNRCQRYDEAARAFKNGLKIKSDCAMLRWNLALAYQKLGKKNGAIQNIKKAIAFGLEPVLQRHAEILLTILRDKP